MPTGRRPRTKWTPTGQRARRRLEAHGMEAYLGGPANHLAWPTHTSLHLPEHYYAVGRKRGVATRDQVGEGWRFRGGASLHTDV